MVTVSMIGSRFAVKNLLFIVVVGAIFFFPGAGRILAQQSPAASSGSIPIEPPPGWDPERWAEMRKKCLDIATRAREHKGTMEDMPWREVCLDIGGGMGEVERTPSSSTPVPSPRALTTAEPSSHLSDN